MAGNKVVLKFLADVNGINKGVDQVNNRLSGFQKGLTNIGFALAGAFAVDKVVDFAKIAIGSAVDMQETLSKTTQIFGNQAADMETWAKGAAVSMGLSTGAALDAAGTFGIYATKAGLAGQETVAFSQDLTGLAADLASFYNTSVNDALSAIQQGLRGENEALRKYGIFLDDATLKQGVFDATGKEVTGTLTAQQKVLGANNQIWAQAGVAVGDFERTSDGIANTMRTLQAATENATASIGGGFLTAIESMNRAMGGGEGMAGLIEETGQVMGDFIAGLGVLISKVMELAPATEQAANEVEPLQRNWSDFFAAITNADDPLIALGNVIYWLGNTERTAAEETKKAEEALLAMDRSMGRYGTTVEGTRYLLEYKASASELAAKAELDHAEALKMATANLKEYDKASSLLASRTNLATYFLELNKDLEDVGTKFNLASKKGIAAIDLLNEGAGQIYSGAQQRLDAGWTEEEVNAWMEKSFGKLKKKFVTAGFKDTEVDKWLNRAGWTKSITNLGVNLVGLAEKIGNDAFREFKGVGVDVGNGLVAGLESQNYAVNNAGARLAAQAEQGARNESQTQSPSKKWYLLGLDLVEGLKKGFEESSTYFQDIVINSFSDLQVTAYSESVKVSNKFAEGFNNRKQAFEDALTAYEDVFAQKLQAIKAISDDITNQVVGNLGFNLTKEVTDSLGKTTTVALTPEEMMNALFGDIEKQGQVVEAVATNIGTSLPPILLNKILGLPADAAIALADYLGANPALTTRLNENYQKLVDDTENSLGIPMGEAWAKIGSQSADQALASAKQKVADEASDFKKWVTKKLKTTVVIDVEYRAVNSPTDVISSIQGYEVKNGTSWRQA